MMEIKKGAVAVIFVLRRSGADAEGYAQAAAEMETEVALAGGYLGHDSVSGADSFVPGRRKSSYGSQSLRGSSLRWQNNAGMARAGQHPCVKAGI